MSPKKTSSRDQSMWHPLMPHVDNACLRRGKRSAAMPSATINKIAGTNTMASCRSYCQMVDSLAALASVNGLTASKCVLSGRGVGERAPNRHANVLCWSHTTHCALLVLGDHAPGAQIEHDVAAAAGANVPRREARENVDRKKEMRIMMNEKEREEREKK